MSTPPLYIEIRPNCSLSVRAARRLFAGACLLPCGIAVWLALRGFWPILPFAGLEMALLGWALSTSLERRLHRQTITVSDAQVTVDTQARSFHRQVVFPRHWAQVKLRRPVVPQHPSRLTIESHGRQCELGSFLTEAERRGLAQRLHQVIGRINESPTWP